MISNPIIDDFEGYNIKDESNFNKYHAIIIEEKKYIHIFLCDELKINFPFKFNNEYLIETISLYNIKDFLETYVILGIQERSYWNEII